MKIFYFVSIFLLVGCSNKTSLFAVDSVDIKDDVEYLIEKSCQCDISVDYEISNVNKYSYSFQNKTLIVQAPTIEEMHVVAYSYLDKLGFEFYGPENHWTYIPYLNLNDLEIRGDVKINFSHNTVIPSGGLGLKRFSSLDRSKKLWKRWTKRLRYSNKGNFSPTHYGGKFNKKYKNLILSNHNWRPKGKKFILTTGKLCYNNSQVIDLFIDDAVDRLQAQIAEGRTGPYYITVEPSDGGGHCSEDLQEISDSVFKLANKVARQLKKINKDAWVTLYAYNDHALVPSFKLEDNILVGVVTDAFQREKSPNVLLSEWENHHSEIYFLGYMNLPVWEYDLSMDWNSEEIVKTIKRYKTEKYFGYRYEVSPSFFVNGWNFYSVSKATYGDFNSQKEYEEFLEKMFPNNNLKSYFNLLVKKDTEIFLDDLIVKLLNERDNTIDNELIMRIDDMIYYAKYKLMFKKYKNDNSINNLNDLVSLLALDNNKLNVHSYVLHNQLTRKNKVLFDEVVPEDTYTPRIDEERMPIKNYKTSLKKRNLTFFNGSKKSSRDKSIILNVRDYLDGQLFYDGKEPLVINLKANKFFKNAVGELQLVHKTTGAKYSKYVNYNNGFNSYKFDLEHNGVYSVKLVRLKGTASIILPDFPFALTNRHVAIEENNIIDFYFHTCNDELGIEIPPKMKLLQVLTYPEGKVIFETKKNIKGKSVRIDIPKPGIYNIKTYRNTFKIVSEPHNVSLDANQVWFSECNNKS